ncbi:MAG: GNAT family N-acetyltransferase [Ardenticatenaceae bacterium]|nr:GNAT family N-acetyltransferase [Anaerolineales bacterium]MCB8922278.1 GNAT family N-acetyltransferase [Ardenticatenaceae bacterium]MCB8990537.1 GNAT family N-acetyltransferase [Ardenticatenaceae bacterium]
MSLPELRRAIRPLLDPRQPRDAMDDFFAFHHPDSRTRLVIHPEGAQVATGYVAISRTGMDLFRPLITLRLPPLDMDAGVDLIYRALSPGTAVFLSAPEEIYPLIQALFDIQIEDHLHIYALSPERFEPMLNVLVTQSQSANGLPRFVVRSEAANHEVAASAHLNWQSPAFGEIAVNVQSRFRRRGWGRSVVAAMVQYLLANGRTPLYAVSPENTASLHLAQTLGFSDTGARTFLIEATLRQRP